MLISSDMLGVYDISFAIFWLLCTFSFTYGDQDTRVPQLEDRVAALEKQGKLQSQLIANLLERLDKHEVELTLQSETIQTQSEQLQKQDHVVHELVSALQSQNIQLKRQNQYILILKKDQKTQVEVVKDLADQLKKKISTCVQDKTKKTDPVGVRTNKKQLTETETKEFLLQTSSGDLETDRSHKRQLLNNSEQVAFHAVIDKGEVPNLGINQNIIFDVILLNSGGAYHDQHGVFIAPTQGLYMFSVSIMSFINSHPEYQADLKKNGVVLAKVYGHGDSGRHDQGSVTVVTQMGVGDEVWVSLEWPPGGSVYGSKYSSFTGYLIYPVAQTS